jgi:hypothetical protein
MGTGEYRERNPDRKIVGCTNVRKWRQFFGKTSGEE